VAFAGAGRGTTTGRMLEFAEEFGIAKPGKTAYAPTLKRGKVIDSYLIWRLDAGGTCIEATIPRADMPGFQPVSVEGLNDGWSVHFLDRARPWPNHRALPVRDGRAFAQLDLNEADSDVFIGHPVICDAGVLAATRDMVRGGPQPDRPPGEGPAVFCPRLDGLCFRAER